jgi:hypothetical protein
VSKKPITPFNEEPRKILIEASFPYVLEISSGKDVLLLIIVPPVKGRYLPIIACIVSVSEIPSNTFKISARFSIVPSLSVAALTKSYAVSPKYALYSNLPRAVFKESDAVIAPLTVAIW